MHIGVFGGSFDPVHHGHLIAALEARRLLGLDEVRLIPAGEQPLKRSRGVASAADRLAMLELAAAGVAGLVVDPRECRRPGPSYTIDTLRELREEHPTATLSLLVGADAARDLPGWREVGAIRALATVVILSRPGVDAGPGTGFGRTLVIPAIDISATAVRARIRAGDSVRFFVPDPVARYIADRRLYVDED